jgi:hypothetical protein
MNVDSGDGSDYTFFDADLPFQVKDASAAYDSNGSEGEGGLEVGGGLFHFVSGRVSYPTPDPNGVIGSNPRLIVDPPNSDRVSSQFDVAWNVLRTNFKQADGTFAADKIAIVQVEKTIWEIELDVLNPIFGPVHNHDWLIDPGGIHYAAGSGTIYAMPYPYASHLWSGSNTVYDFYNPPSAHRLSEEDNPGAWTWNYIPPYSLKHFQQKFETYVIGLTGKEGVMCLMHLAVWTPFVAVGTLFDRTEKGMYAGFFAIMLMWVFFFLKGPRVW